MTLKAVLIAVGPCPWRGNEVSTGPRTRDRPARSRENFRVRVASPVAAELEAPAMGLGTPDAPGAGLMACTRCTSGGRKFLWWRPCGPASHPRCGPLEGSKRTGLDPKSGCPSEKNETQNCGRRPEMGCRSGHPVRGSGGPEVPSGPHVKPARIDRLRGPWTLQKRWPSDVS